MFGEIQDPSELVQSSLRETGVLCWLFHICLADKERKRESMMGEVFISHAQNCWISLLPTFRWTELSHMAYQTKRKSGGYHLMYFSPGFGEYNNISFIQPKLHFTFPPTKNISFPHVRSPKAPSPS